MLCTLEYHVIEAQISITTIQCTVSEVGDLWIDSISIVQPCEEDLLTNIHVH